jgi:hypothetical protein
LPTCDEKEPMLAPIVELNGEDESPSPRQHRCACFNPIPRAPMRFIGDSSKPPLPRA